MKYLFLLLFFIGAIFSSYSAPYDSLYRILDVTDDMDQRNIDAKNILSQNLIFIDPYQSLTFANEALQSSMAIEYDKGLAYSYRNLANLYITFDIFNVSTNYLKKSISVFNALNDSTGIANCYISFGHSYRRLNDVENEIYYHKKSYQVFKRIGNKERIGVSAHNLGESYINKGDLAKAEEFTRHAIDINSRIDNLPVLTSCYKALGRIYLIRKEFEKAETYFKEALKISQKLGHNSQKNAHVQSLLFLSEIASSKNNAQEQINYLRHALKISTDWDVNNYLNETYHKIIDFYSAQDNDEKVSYYALAYISLKDSIEERNLEDRAKLLSSAVELYDITEEKKELEERNYLQNQLIESKNIQLWMTLTVAVLVIIFLIIMVQIIRRLKKSNRTLQEQSLIIEKQKIDLEELNHTKNKFFNIVAHDLRSPMATLKNFSMLINNYIDQFSKEELKNLSKDLQTSIDNSIKMTDNLLTWARMQMEENIGTEEVFDPSELVRETLAVYSNAADKKELSLIFENPDNSILLKADKNQVSFIIRNLINNAIKFTKAKGQVHVRILRENIENLKIIVEDNGMGIPEQILNKLFKIDSKISTPGTAGEKGTGLGLMLSREFVHKNNGDIQVQSEEGKGTIFTVTFPILQDNETTTLKMVS